MIIAEKIIFKKFFEFIIVLRIKDSQNGLSSFYLLTLL